MVWLFLYRIIKSKNLGKQFKEMTREQNDETGESSQYNHKGKYTCSYCKGIGHNACSCKLKE